MSVKIILVERTSFSRTGRNCQNNYNKPYTLRAMISRLKTTVGKIAKNNIIHDSNTLNLGLDLVQALY